MTLRLLIPGAFAGYLEGTGALQGERYSRDAVLNRAAEDLAAAYRAGRRIVRGARGYTKEVTLPSLQAAFVLAELAVSCIDANLHGDRDHSELAAARTVVLRVEAVTGERVRYDGWHLLLDGAQVPL